MPELNPLLTDMFLKRVRSDRRVKIMAEAISAGKVWQDPMKLVSQSVRLFGETVTPEEFCMALTLAR